MKVCVMLFARAKDLAGRQRVELELPEGATVRELRHELCASALELAAIASSLLIAVNKDYAAESLVVKPDDEIACFPPVSGG